ncbi:hypothetical protein BDZ89DRAFT_1076601 [Hymenopellis radicata]|nr:hypothetical protein BDZ89DRAFT_1076601 [Hymenopellis radicata]
MMKATNKLFEKHMEKYAPVDPLYEEYTDDRGKKRRRKREVPPGLSARDVKILKSIKRRAHYLDKGFSLCGFQFGWTFFIGIIPGAGDVVDALLNYFLVVRKAKKADIPPWLLRRMLFNNAVSAGFGLVPLAGDIILAAWKANSRNAALLEEFLRIRGEELLTLEAAGKNSDAVVAGSSTSTKKGKDIAKGVSQADVKQVKPGSGETIPGISPVTPNSADSSGKATTASGRSSGRKSFKSWMRPRKAPEAGDKGRFIENVDSKINTPTNV